MKKSLKFKVGDYIEHTASAPFYHKVTAVGDLYYTTETYDYVTHQRRGTSKVGIGAQDVYRKIDNPQSENGGESKYNWRDNALTLQLTHEKLKNPLTLHIFPFHINLHTLYSLEIYSKSDENGSGMQFVMDGIMEWLKKFGTETQCREIKLNKNYKPVRYSIDARGLEKEEMSEVFDGLLKAMPYVGLKIEMDNKNIAPVLKNDLKSQYTEIYWRHYNRYKATEEYKRLYEAIRSLSAAKLALEFEAKQQGKVVNTVEETITDWCETNGYSYDKFFADKVLKDYAEQQARIDGYRELIDKFSTQTVNLDDKLSILAKYFKSSRNVIKVRATQNPPEIGNDPIHAYSYPTGVAYSDVRFEQYTDGNGWDYLSVAYKFNKTGEVKVSCDALPEYKELIAKLKGEDVNKKFTLFQFAQHLSSQFDNGESYDWAKVQRLAKELGVSSTPQELMQACELAVVLSARRIAQNSEWSEGQCFEQMKRLYQLQPIISTNSSESLRLQQYSTPCPISYLAGLYVSRGNGQLYYEPTAGNGMLTVALPPDRTIVNELDPVRVANLKMNGFADVLNDDAVRLADSPLAQRKYNVIMNPPFGSLKPSEYLYRDGKVANNEATYTFKRLDHKIAVLTLEKFLADDNARAAIIVGGKLAAKYNKADDEAYWNKQGRLQGAFGDFISYLNRAYLIDDIFYLDGKLYGKQGTQFPIVLILVRGRRKQWDGDPLCKWRTYDSIRDKQVQSFDELLIRMRPYLAHTDHEALVQRLNAKLVRLERMKIETGTETPKFKYEIGDKFRNEKDGNICTIVDRFVSDGKIGYYLIFPNKVQEQHPVITEENWLDSLVKLPLPKYKVGQMVKWHLVNWTNGYVKDVNWDNLFNTYKYEIIDFSGGMAYEVKEYSMSKISLGYSEEKSYSISQPVCKEGDLIRDKKTKKTYTVRNVLLFNVYHKYKNQRLGVGGTVVKSSASYLYYVCEHRSPYIEKGFAVVEKSLGDANSFEKYQDFIQNALHSNSHGKIECTDLISEHSRQVVNRLLKKNIKGYYIKADDIRHTRNEHGKQSEYLRNQIPITDEDLAKIPEILSVPTSIDLPPYNMRNGQGVRFVKQFADGKIFCVMVDLYESEELSIKTGYKKGIEGFETLMPSPLQGIDELQQTVPKHNVRNARALPMLVANVTNFFRIK